MTPMVAELTVYLRQSRRVRDLADALEDLELALISGRRDEEICAMLEKTMEELLREAAELSMNCRMAMSRLRSPHA